MNKISNEEIEKNTGKYLMLINSIARDGMNKEALVNMLTNSDFFYAPASKNYHGSFKGGLCKHSLAVYDQLVKLVNSQNLNDTISDDTIKILALMHDFAKINYYKTSFSNKKVYSESGSKRDENGNFDWVSVQGYTTVDENEMFVYGSHEMNSEKIAQFYTPLTMEESAAILHHHGGMGFDSAKDNVMLVFERYPVALLLHLADMLAVNIDKV